MMPRTCTVAGTLARPNGMPVNGLVRFIPQRLWVVEKKTHWACLAPVAMLDYAGNFSVQVTATDTDTVLWHYLVQTPAGDFRVYIPWDEKTYGLKELVDDHRVGARPSDRR